MLFGYFHYKLATLSYNGGRNALLTYSVKTKPETTVDLSHNDNDNENSLFDHYFTTKKTLYRINVRFIQVTDWSGDYYLDKVLCCFHNSDQ